MISSAMKFGLLPPSVRKEHRNQRRPHGADHGPAPDRHRQRGAIEAWRCRSSERKEACDDHHADRGQLEDGEDVLRHRAEGDAEAVDQREQQNGGYRRGPRHVRRDTEERGAVVAEGDRHRGDGTRRDDEEQPPGVEKGGEGAERLSQVGVATPHLGAPLPQLPIDERSDQRHQPAADPDANRGGRSADPLRHDGGIEEDAGADDATDDGHRAGEETETAGIRNGHRCSRESDRRRYGGAGEDASGNGA